MEIIAEMNPEDTASKNPVQMVEQVQEDLAQYATKYVKLQETHATKLEAAETLLEPAKPEIATQQTEPNRSNNYIHVLSRTEANISQPRFYNGRHQPMV